VKDADMSTIKATLSEVTKNAMKAGEKNTVTFARSLNAAIRKKEIDERIDLDDAGTLKIIATLVKQRQDSIDMFRQGGRLDLVEKESAELQFLQSFMPTQLSENELRTLIDSAVLESKAAGIKDIGAVMKLLQPKIQGLADGKLVNQLVRERLIS
jgi:uncharacterized protein YqeY